MINKVVNRSEDSTRKSFSSTNISSSFENINEYDKYLISVKFININF